MPNPVEFHNIKVARSSTTTAQVDTVLVAAIAGKRHHITKLVVSLSASADVDIESSTANAIISFLAVTQVVLDGEDFRHLQTVNGESLTYSTSAGNAEVYVEYYTLPE